MFETLNRCLYVSLLTIMLLGNLAVFACPRCNTHYSLIFNFILNTVALLSIVGLEIEAATGVVVEAEAKVVVVVAVLVMVLGLVAATTGAVEAVVAIMPVLI